MRLPFEGVAAFYRALHAGSTGHSLNPMFYVSNSAWNLYDLLSDFFNLHQIPIGPVLFLRDWGLSKNGLAPLKPGPHKLAYIRGILDTFKHLPFILIGDSGEQDPEIYTEVVGLYPNRIRAVYIRNVSRKPKRLDEIKVLAEQVLAAGSTLILAETTVPLAQHAASQGWIQPERVIEVEIEKEADKAPPGPVEKLLREEKAKAPTVVVPGETAAKTAEAVDKGAIEAALDTKTAKKEETPTVIVDPTEDPLKEKDDKAGS
jgi:phosphatidate phosphatase APP1